MDVKVKEILYLMTFLIIVNYVPFTRGVPHRFVDIQDNEPVFQRSSVERNPFESDGENGKLKFASLELEEKVEFSRSAVESIPITLVSYYQPLRSAVEFIPPHDNDYSMKTRFLKIVDPKKYRESRAFSLDAYDTSKPADHRPDRYSIDSPYQQLVDPREFEEQVIRESNSEQKEDNKPIPSRLKAINNDLKVVCFVTNWSFYRKKDGKYVPENLNPKLCTHIIFVYAKLDPDLLELIEFDKWTDLENQLYSRTVGLDRDVSVLLGIGGWTDSVGDKYTRLVSNARNRKNFIQKAISFLREHRFKGLHFDWNYPICWQSDCKAGQATDKDYFSIFMEEMSREFKKYNLILSTSISGYKEIIAKSYDMKSLSRSVDFFTVMTYDYHGSWETKTGHVSPLYGSNDDTYPQYNTDFAMQYLVNLGADKEKLIMGIPFYGQSFTLSKQKSNQAFNSVALGPGMAGEFTLQPGMLSYSEICDNIRTKQWVKGFDQSKKSGPYASDGKQWVGYDDVEMVRIKTRYAANEGFGGVAAWTVDLDDFNNRCCFESSPLLKAINREIGRLTSRVPSGQDCTPEKMPITPTPPTMATTLESGQAGIPSASSSTPSSYFTSPKPTTTSSTTTTMRTTTSSVSRPTVPQPINVMPSSCEEGTFQPDPSNCGAYYICSNNNLVQSQCPNNLHWNNGAKSCDWPANAQCEIRETQPAETSTTKKRRKKTTTSTTTEATTTTTTTTTRKPKTTTTTTTTRKPPTTTPYLITTMSTRKTTKIKEQPTTMSYETYPTTTERQTTRSKSTPRPDYYTSIILMTQLDSRTSTTKRPSGAKRPPCVNGQYYPHKTCEKFYVCVNGKRTKFDCPQGTQYSTKLKSCDDKENVNCVSKKQYLKLIQDHYAKTRIYTAALLKASAGEICENEVQQMFYSSPEDCGKYFVCDHNRLLSLSCPSGLHFNSGQNVCDWPEQVKCAYATSQDEQQNEGEDEEDFEYEEDESEEVNILQEPTTKRTEISSTTRATTSSYKPPTSSEKSKLNAIQVPDQVQSLDGNYKLVCYFTNWAWYRPGIGKYLPEDIDPNICTHIVYGFAVLNYDELIIKAHDDWADYDNKFYERVVAYKQKGIKVSLALGGWNDSAGDKYSRLVRNPSARAKFVRQAVQFLEKYGFDGLDLDWEYPVCWQVDCKKGYPDEKQNFAELVKELHDAFEPKGLLLSSAVSPSKTVIDAGYDVPSLNKYLDWIAVMTYDYHGQWDKKTGHVAPIYYREDDDNDYFNINYTINYWIKLGASPSKIIMGMPLYGQSFTLSDERRNGLNANAPGGGTAGEFTRASGFLSFYEICDRVLNQGWTVVNDPQGRIGPYAYKGNQWVSFDDQPTLQKKTNLVKQWRLGGAMVWALDLDDFKNRCGLGKHPLLKIIHAGLRDETVATTQSSIASTKYTQSSTSSYSTTTVKEDEEYDEYYEDEDNIETNNNETPKPIDNVTKPPSHDVEITTPKVDEIDESEEEEEEEEDFDDENEIDTSAEDFRVVCYFTNWAWYRPGIGKFLPENIDPELCTHIVYGFAVLNRDTLTIQPHDSWADIDNNFYKRVCDLKKKGLKVSVAIGGWNDSAGDKYSRLVRSAESRRKFIKHVTEFIEKYDFDGLDLDWEYPVCWQVDCTKGKADEKEHFSSLVEELSAVFKPKGLLLSSAVSPAKKVIDAGYDVPKLAKHFDWIAVMTYDYHGQWDKKTGHVAPMYTHKDAWEPTFNANFTINYWIEKGAPRKSLVMGIPMYGQSFSLADASNNGLNAMTYGGGEAGEETRARGFLAYYEICQNIKNKNWEVVRDNGGKMGPYARKKDQWVSFDDVSMVRYKSQFIKAMGLGGAMIWALDLDDFKNVCGCEEYPLLRTINRVLRKYPETSKTCVLEENQIKNDPPVKPTKKPNMKDPEMSTTKRTEVTKTSTATKSTTKRTTTTVYQDEFDEDFHDEKKGCNEGEFVRHETNCEKYYRCVHNKLTLQTCANGLHWNKDRCDWPAVANCKGTVSQDEISNEVDDVESSSVPSYQPSSTTSSSSNDKTSTTQSSTVKTSTTSISTKTTTKNPWAWVPPSEKPREPSFPDSPFELTGKEEFKMVCYFTNWAWYRPGAGKYKPENIDPNLCTHIVYGFAVLNRETLTIRTHDSWADIDNQFYGKVADYRLKGIKVTLAIGGWNDSLGDKYSRLVLDPEARARFIKHVIEFIKKYGFDGLDLDWEYPVCWQVDCTKGKAEEKEAFADFVQELSEAFKPENLLLSAAVSPAKKVIDAGYDIPKLSKYFDWIAVMCYDYHGQWDKKTGHVAPLYEHPEDWETTFNGNFSIRYWISKGAPPKKLVMGMPMYGQSFTLEKVTNNGLNAISTGPGTAGPFTRAAGFLAFYEICEKINNGGWTVVRDDQGRIGPYAYKDRQWVSYDDVDDIRKKTQFVKDLNLGGAMIWALDLDDFRNTCGCGYHPLLSTINLELGRITTSKRNNCT